MSIEYLEDLSHEINRGEETFACPGASQALGFYGFHVASSNRHNAPPGKRFPGGSNLPPCQTS